MIIEILLFVIACELVFIVARAEQTFRIVKQQRKKIVRKTTTHEQANTEQTGSQVRVRSSGVMLQQIAQLETFTTKELAQLMNIGERAAQKQIKKMLEAGKLTKKRKGKKVFYKRNQP